MTAYENISNRLLSKFLLRPFIMRSFSSRHSRHVPDPPAEIFFTKDHFILNGRFSVFNFQTCFESSVSFLYLLLRSDFPWFLYRVLNSFAVTPMYVCILSLSVVVTSAL